MALIIEKYAAAYDLTQIKCGNLIYGRHRTWDKGKAGFVTAATEKQLTVQYHPGIGDITNHFIIPAWEAADGQWEIRWSADLTEVSEYGIKADEEQQEPEGADEDETGGTDL